MNPVLFNRYSQIIIEYTLKEMVMKDKNDCTVNNVRQGIRRRSFIAGIGAGAVMPAFSKCNVLSSSVCVPYAASQKGKRWFKGNTHMHTLRSDGRSLPVEAAALFKRDGYNFICFTDHNVSSAEPFKVFPIDSTKGKRVEQAIAGGFERDFPDLELFRKVKDEKGRECYTSPSFDEIGRMLNEEGKFLVIGGNEVSAAPTAGRELHCNFINYSQPCKANNKRTVEECLDWIRGEYNRVVGDSQMSVMTVNHPLWVSYDVSPLIVAQRPDIKFFEVCNSGSMPRFERPGKQYNHDKWWDVVNTVRAIKGQKLVYGVASDDIHEYGGMRKRAKRSAGYVQVLADTLSIPDVMTAFHRGDFYSSTGLNLESVKFDCKTRTLSVTVDPAFGDDCKISFIGSKKGVDTSVKELVKWEVTGELNSWLQSRHFSRQRTVERFSDDIGCVFKSVKGRTASYTMQPDDLYVRAKIVCPANADTDNREPKFPVAWTQPISWEKVR
jgi:predicted metal-dependent phosphoesterase TrpH